MSTDNTNIAESLAKVLPKIEALFSVPEIGGKADDTPAKFVLAVPNNTKLETLDMEGLLPNPRRTKGVATMGDQESFIAYVNRFAKSGTAVWCDFQPQTAKLDFKAVIDEHAPDLAGWRGHTATYSPAMSIEWMNWKGSNGSNKTFGQVEFAEFLEKNENDIAQVEGYPTSLQMHAMATEFVARQDMSIKSSVRLQDGGVRLNYIADADAGTVEQMKLFEKFAIGIPVFWTVPGTDGEGKQLPVAAYRIDARLKYRLREGKVSFWYELIRPDRVHQMAALELIQAVKAGIGDVPLRMGSFA